MTPRAKKSGRQPRRSLVRHGRRVSPRYDAGWPERLKQGNAAIQHFHEIMKKRLQVAR